MVKTHYTTLGVSRDATADEIRAAWRVVARRLHPDRPGGDAAAFAEASAAYNVIGDFYERQSYDTELRLLYDTCVQCGGGGRTFRQKGFTERIPSICRTCGGSGVTRRKS